MQKGNGKRFFDDDFFHLTCHIDPQLRIKIQKGEFVDLEKLIPKDKVKGRLSEEARLEWVFRDGSTFLVSASDRDHKITSIRRWDQAFRVYATIYCGANPQKSQEIWQYVSVINTAAASYAWDNVVSYDYTFRHLMAFNPSRSWASTYNQMWNLCMKDPLPKGQKFNSKSGTGAAWLSSSFFHGGHNSGTSSNNHAHANAGSNSTSKKSGKPRYCWYFNRGEKCKYGAKCHFVEKCSYCDSSEHAVLSCPKLVKKAE